MWGNNKGEVKVNIKKYFFLFLLVLCVFSVSATDDWLEYGQNPASTHFVLTNGTSFEGISINLSIGQKFEPIVTNLTGDSKLETIIWNGTQIFIVNLSNGGAIAQFSIGAELLGQPAYFNGKYFALVKNGSDSLFYELNLTKSDFSLDFSLKVGDSDDVEMQGIKCVQNSGINYCVFMDINNTIYRINLDSGSFSKFEVTRGIRNTTIPFLRIPAIGDLDNDNDYEAVFSFTNESSSNSQHANLFAYDIISNTGLSTFGTNGYLRVFSSTINMSSPLIHNFDSGLPEIAVIHGIGNARLDIFNSSGGFNATQGSSNDFDIYTQPFVAKCDFNTTGSGVGYFSARTGITNSYKIIWIDSNFTGHVVPISFSFGTSEPFKFNRIVSTADFDNSGSSKIIASINQQGSFTLSAFSCDETSGTEVGNIIKNISTLDGFYIPIIIDFDNNTRLDIMATGDSKTNVFNSNTTTTDLEILEVIPVQVVRDVDMVLGKSGLVRVNVKNNGPLDTNASVTVSFEGNPLLDWDNGITTNITETINNGANASFDFRFSPSSTGTRTFSAEVITS